MALLPYLEWVPYQDFKERFFKIITTHGSDAPLRCILQRLHKDGLIEKKYDGRPKGVNPQIEEHLSSFLFIRRVAKSVPRTATGMKQKAAGTYGMKADKEKARHAIRELRPKLPPKTTVKNLTLDDLQFIQSASDINGRALAEMFQLNPNLVYKIRKGHVPAHLRVPLARLRSSGIQVETSHTPSRP